MAISSKQLLIRTALETFADFGHAKKVGILLFNRETSKLETSGYYDQGTISLLPLPGPVAPDSPVHEVFSTGQIRIYPGTRDPFPLPSSDQTPPAATFCLCIPVALSSQAVNAIVTLIIPTDSPDLNQIQHLRMLGSMFAVSLENMRLFEMAIYDSLTGVHVRRYFEIKAKEEMAAMQRTPQTMGIILMDIDEFKTVNDHFGHIAGDKLLVEFARQISQGLRKDIDIVCRYGGDEFVIILPRTERAETKAVARRIQQTIHRHRFTAVPKDYEISLSAGAMTIGPDDHITIQELIHRVDRLLYAGKKRGGNRVICLEEEEDSNTENGRGL